jgi:hypothetical protein
MNVYHAERSYRFRCKENCKICGIIAKIRHFTNLNTLKLIYYALVYPYLIYGNLIWTNTYKTRIQKLKNIQKKIIHLMTFQSNFSHTEKIFIDLQILNLSKLNNYLNPICTGGALNERTPINIYPSFLNK